MTASKTDLFAPGTWLRLMGADLPEARAAACQPVRVEGGRATLFAGALNGPFEPGAKLGFERRANRIVVAETPDGVELPEAGWWDEGKHVELPLPDEARSLLPAGDPALCLLVKTDQAVGLPPADAEAPPLGLKATVAGELRGDALVALREGLSGGCAQRRSRRKRHLRQSR